MIPDRREFITLGVGALAVAVVPSVLRRRPTLVRRQIPVMGTVGEVAVLHTDEVWAHRAIDTAFVELRRVESAMTRFRPESDVGRLNLGCDRWVGVADDTAYVLEEALRWAELSGGCFDPCLGRATELWDPVARATPPPVAAVRHLADLQLWRSLEVDRGASAPRARLLSARAAVDLGGIAKGFGVDAAAEALRGSGVFHGLVNVGGDLVALGVDAAGEPWRVGVRSPENPRRMVDVLNVSDGALATSGDYLRFFEHRGRRYHHLLDPGTGEPRWTEARSLTVKAESCIDADAAATALFGAPAHTAGLILDRVASSVSVVHEI